jgi:hypothetical protein
VGLLTARRAGLGDSQDVIFAGQPAGPVIAALTAVAVALLDTLAPGDAGERVLRALGLAAAGTAMQAQR